MRFGTGALVVGLICAVASSWARGDEVLFKNGDRLTGTVASAADGKLVINTKVAGKVTVDIGSVQTFSTDKPIKIRFQNGQIVMEKVGAAGEGMVAAVGGGETRPTAIALDRIAKINEEIPHWTGSIVANAQFERDTNTTEQYGATANAVRKTDTDQTDLDAAYLYGSSKTPGQGEQTNTDNWFVSTKYEDFFSKKFYGYADARVEKDRINFLNLRLTPGLGVGYQWVARPDFNFHTEAGISDVYEDYGDGGGVRNDVSARLAYHVDKGFFDNHLTIYNDVDFFPSLQDANNYLLLTDLGVRTPINEKLFTEVKIIVNYDSNPAPQAARTDEKLLIGVGYKF